MRRGFTLIELIIVIIIVGILAAVGISQYSTIVEKSRVAEARVRIGAISKIAYEYYLNNGTFVGLTDADLDMNTSCNTSSYYRYITNGDVSASAAFLYAFRCTSEGKTPQGPAYALQWRLGSSGDLTQDGYLNSGGEGWVFTSNWGGCCR